MLPCAPPHGGRAPRVAFERELKNAQDTALKKSQKIQQKTKPIVLEGWAVARGGRLRQCRFVTPPGDGSARRASAERAIAAARRAVAACEPAGSLAAAPAPPPLDRRARKQHVQKTGTRALCVSIDSTCR